MALIYFRQTKYDFIFQLTGTKKVAIQENAQDQRLHIASKSGKKKDARDGNLSGD